MTTRLISTVPITLVTAAALTLIACSSPPTRAGQAVDPVTLTSETTGGAGGTGGDVLAQLVDITSNEPVQVTEPKGAAYSDDYEGDIIEALKAGTFDLSVVRADRLAMAGADSLAVLQTPLLVTNDDQAAAIAADPVADDLMAGLDDIRLTGIALVPGGLRHPFGYNTALYGPDDYAGATFNTRYGTGVDAIFGALGTTTDHSRDQERTDKARSGELRGIETSVQQLLAVDKPAVLTSNVTLYEKFDVVVVRSDTWDGLTEAQQEALRASAIAAGRDALAARDTEAQGLERWCASPDAASVVASQDQLAAFRAAWQPVIDEATAVPGAAELAERVSVLGDNTTAPSGTTCGALDADGNVIADTPSAGASEYEVTRTGPQDVLDGVWRLVADKNDMLEAGVSPQEAGINAGVWTITIIDHIAQVDQPTGPDCIWDFAFDGERVSIDFAAEGNDACWGQAIGTYQLDGDVATFNWEKSRDYDVVLDQAMFAQGMTRIG
jgi:TRAP-type C4-dicarboxylate transport system substrate-binding protein